MELFATVCRNLSRQHFIAQTQQKILFFSQQTKLFMRNRTSFSLEQGKKTMKFLHNFHLKIIKNQVQLSQYCLGCYFSEKTEDFFSLKKHPLSNSRTEMEKVNE